ncbi:MAG: hypothetical protein ACR2F8_04050 [Caulobacteraceae bacterium]
MAGKGAAGGDGAHLSAGGGLVNAGVIVAGEGGGGGSVGDFGVKRGGAGAAGGAGVRLTAGGDILNTGTIRGGQGGAGSYDYYNGGRGGNGGAGIVLSAGGTVDNRGLIEGGAGGAGGQGRHHRYGRGGAAGVGIFAGPGAAATVTNAGTIVGAVNSVVFAQAGDILIADAGAQFVGAIVGGGGTFVLAGGTGAVSGLGGAGQVSGTDSATFSGFGSYGIGAGGHWSLTGTNVLAAGQSLTVDGVLTVDGSLSEAAGAAIAIDPGGVLRFQAPGQTLAGSIVNNGLLAVQGTSLTVTGSVSGFGQAAIDDGTLGFTSFFSENVAFAGRSGVLQLAQSRNYFGTIFGFAAGGGDALDLRDIAFTSAGEATFSGSSSGGFLTIDDGTHSARIRLAGDYVGDTFVAASDGAGGVIVTAMAAGPPALHAFVAAMAGLGAAGAIHPVPADLHAQGRPTVFAPRGAPA